MLYDDKGKLIYVGKAKSLKNRLGTYFHSGSETYKTHILKDTFEYYDIIVTGSETEALMLENNLIKEHQPVFNFMLKDDKSFPYLAYNKNMPYPFFFLARAKNFEKNVVYLGPYTNPRGLRCYIDFLNRKYGLRLCRGRLPSRACIYNSVKKCRAPCVNEEERRHYKENFGEALKAISSGPRAMIAEIRESMSEAAEDYNYEEAAFYRDIISFLEGSREVQNVTNQKGNFDVISYSSSGTVLMIGIFHYIKGSLVGIFTDRYDHFSDDRETVYDFIQRYYLENEIRGSIILSDEEDRSVLEEYFKSVGGKARIVSGKGKYAPHMAFAAGNIGRALNDITGTRKHADLNSLFPGARKINIVDAFDISHISGSYTVGGVVRFKNQKPDKTMYRAYILPSSAGRPDDFASIKGSISKHFTHIEKHGFEMPDMLLIDGGKGQLSAALHALAELSIEDIAVASIAKGGTDRIFTDPAGSALPFSATNPILRFLVSVRDEVHRFSVSRHLKRRDKVELSILTEVPGIGEKRALKLLRHFKTIANIRKAAEEELTQFLPAATAEELLLRISEP